MADDTAGGEKAGQEEAQEYWTITEWSSQFPVAECGEKLKVDRYYIYCPCKGHHWCSKTNPNSKGGAIGAIWQEDDAATRMFVHLTSSTNHVDDNFKYTLEWCEDELEQNPALRRKEEEVWTVAQLNSDPPQWVKCPRMPKSKKHGNAETADGKGKGKKGKDKSSGSWVFKPQPPEPRSAPSKRSLEMSEQHLAPQPLALQTPLMAMPVPHLISMANAGIGPQNARTLLASGLDGAKSVPHSCSFCFDFKD